MSILKKSTMQRLSLTGGHSSFRVIDPHSWGNGKDQWGRIGAPHAHCKEKKGKSSASPPYRGWVTDLTFKTPSCSKSHQTGKSLMPCNFCWVWLKEHFRMSSIWATKKKKKFFNNKKMSKWLRIKSKYHLKVRWNTVLFGQLFLLISFLKPDKGHSGWYCDKANREPRLGNRPSSTHMR